MFNKFMITLSLCCSFYSMSLQAEPTQSIQSERNTLAIPQQFSVTQRWFSFTKTFDIGTKTTKLGMLHRRIFSLTLQYDFYDVDDKLQVKARARFFALGAVFDITDSEDRLIGIVDEKLFRFLPTFEILSPQKEVLAHAKRNFWGTRYSLRDPVTQKVFVEMTRPFFRLKDNWTVTITDPELYAKKELNPSLFITIMALQTDRDYWAAHKMQQQSTNMTMSLFSSNTTCCKDSRFIDLRDSLEFYRHVTTNQEPTEKNGFDLEQIIENYLLTLDESVEELETSKNEEEIDLSQHAQYEQTRIYQKLSHLLPLLDSDFLTIEQKATLFFMIDDQLKQLKY